MINRILMLPVLLWRYCLSPFLPPACRFYPTCSQYALDALKTLPWYRALPLMAWRVLRCNPFHPGGFDPVPEPKQCCSHHNHPKKGIAHR